MANISNSANSTIISGTSGADSISNSGTNVTINGWAGNDSVSLNGGANISINAGKGNDQVYNNGYYDDDDWRLGVDSVTIDGGDGDDYIYNTGSNVSVDGGNGNDSIDSFGQNKKSTLYGGAGSDSIDNNGYLTIIDGGADDDYIDNSGEAVSINGGSGNDSISNWGVSTSIEGGKGNDTIINSEKVYHNEDSSSDSYGDIGSDYDDDDNSGVGMVYVYRAGDGNDLIQGFDEDDTVLIADSTWTTNKSGSNVIVTVGDGKITLRGAASLSAVNIVSSAEDISPINIIKNNTAKTLITGTKYRDSIVNGSLWNNECSGSTIMSGDGNDTIENWGSFSSINCGAGNDYIYIPSDIWYLTGQIKFANGVSIEGGKGNDTLESHGVGTIYIYNNGDGNDSIVGFDDDDTLLIASGTWSTAKSGDNVIVTVGNGKITLRDAASLSAVNVVSSVKDVHPVTFIGNSRNNILITGTSYKDSIYNDKASNVTINGGADDDTLRNVGGSNVSIDGGAGNDIIESHLPTYASGRVDTDFLSCKNVTINGGAGNDHVYNDIVKTTISGGDGNDYIYNSGGSTGDVEGLGASVSIDGGAGDDSIDNSGDNVTIDGGTGNDYIDNYGNYVTINGGGGNDTIESWAIWNMSVNGGKDDDLISLGSYAKNALVKYVAGDGNDTIIGFNEDDTILIPDGTWTTVKSGSNVIVNVGNGSILLRGAASLASINITASASNIPSAKILRNSQNNTLITGTSYSDSIFNSGENVTIKGWSGNDSIENDGDSVTIEAGAGNDSIRNDGNYATIDGGNGNDSIFNWSYLTSISSGAGNDTVSNLYGNRSLIDLGDGNDSVYNTGDSVTIDAGADNDYISNDLASGNVSIIGGDGDDFINNLGYNATISGSKGNDTIVNNYSIEDGFAWYDDAGSNVLFKYTAGDGNDIIYGFNDTSTLQIIGSYSSTKSGSDIIVTVGDGSITLQGAASLSAVHIDGEQATKTLTLKDSNSNKITLPGAYTSADASARTKSINLTGNATDNSILGGKAADTLAGGSGNDTLTGGWGADTFVYTGGNDVITDYGANFDKVSIAGDGAKYLSHITGVDVSSSDVKLTFSNDSNKTLTLNGAAGKKVILNGATRYFADKQIISYDKKSVTLTAAFSGTFNAGSYSKVDASAVNQSVTISGGNLSGVSIVGGKKADSITGTTGNDTLTGGYGADTFVYTGGQDVITDYAANFDKISLAGGNNAKWLSHITGVSVKNNNVTLTFGNDTNKTLTLNNAAGKKVIINGATRIFEDGKIYTADKSKSTVVSAADGYWFDEHDFTQGAQLDSLMETSTNYSIDKLDTSDNLTKLTQDEFILTYGDDK